MLGAVPITSAGQTSGRKSRAGRLVRLGFVGAWLVFTTGCTATNTREFTRESYIAPDLPVGHGFARSRVFAASKDRVFEEVLAGLRRRPGEIDRSDAASGRVEAHIFWRTGEERDAAVALGRVHKVVTRTRRDYRSFSPLDARCGRECIVKNGKLIGQRTELLEDRTIELEARRYQVAARLLASVSTVRSGTRLELTLELAVRPAKPPGIAPLSTGRFEDAFLDGLQQALGEAPPTEAEAF